MKRHIKRRLRKRLLPSLAIAALALSITLLFTSSTTAPGSTIRATPTPTAKATPKPTPTPTPLPTSAKLTVPFLVQAPFGKWDPLHEDACEETSLMMVWHHHNGTTFTREEGDAEITELVHYEEDRGYGVSITLQELNMFAKMFYGFDTGRIETVTTVDDIKKEIAAGRPVIVGAAGKELENNHFSNGGPVYHMLVVIGYDAQGFITNDPGISQGKDFRYSYENLLSSIHNWDPTDIKKGAKELLVFD